MFDLPLVPAPSPSATSAAAAAEGLDAAEAALAAELASTFESGGVATDAPDSRTRLRVDVSLPARMRLPDGRLIELQVRNLSEGGVGLVGDEHIPARTLVDLEMDMPALDQGGRTTPVKVTIKTTYKVVRGSEVLCGGTWVHVQPADLDIVSAWIQRQLS